MVYSIEYKSLNLAMIMLELLFDQRTEIQNIECNYSEKCKPLVQNLSCDYVTQELVVVFLIADMYATATVKQKIHFRYLYCLILCWLLAFTEYSTRNYSNLQITYLSNYDVKKLYLLLTYLTSTNLPLPNQYMGEECFCNQEFKATSPTHSIEYNHEYH